MCKLCDEGGDNGYEPTYAQPLSIIWVSIEDKHPEEGNKVLAWGVRNSAFWNINGTEDFFGLQEYSNGAFNCEKYGGTITNRVTHWCELNGPNV